MRFLSATLCLMILAACASPAVAPSRTSHATPDAGQLMDSGGYTVVVTPPTKVTTAPAM
jgi:hypothetical protein